jgi:hypothetical protein
MSTVALPKLSDGTTGFLDDNGTWVCTGSRMGRRDKLPDDTNEPVKLRLVELKMVDGCYDQGGAYWGCWSPSQGGMYRAYGEGSEFVVELFVRAKTRDDAKRQVLAKLPKARFYR